MGNRLSEEARIELLDADDVDVGGTTAATGWVSMAGYDRALFMVRIGTTWNAGDDVDHCRIEEDILGDGAAITEVTSDASGGNYDTDSPIDAATNFIMIEIRAADLPAGKPYIRGVVGEDGNTGTDNVNGVLILYDKAHKAKEIQGAAVAGEKVYVDPST